MDLYLTCGEPGLSLQEMIDCDIKEGIDFEDGTTTSSSLDSVVTSHDLNDLDISGMSNLEAEMDLKTFEPLFDPLDHLDDMDVVVMGGTPNSDGKESIRSISPPGGSPKKCSEVVSEIASWMSLNSTANYNLDIENSVMVDPSIVLPSGSIPKAKPITTPKPFSQAQVHTQPSSTQDTKPLTFTSVPSERDSNIVQLKKEPTTGPAQAAVVQKEPVELLRYYIPHPQSTQANSHTNQIIIASQPSSSTAISNSIQTHHIISSSAATQSSEITRLNFINVSSASVMSTPNTHHYTSTSSYTSGNNNRVGPYINPNRNFISSNRPKPKFVRSNSPPPEKILPKPAYSYSCLIALALKNSITGSLPVSEIYNFMCEHFPYFKTAPTGWKNSVRHNLSLNKCFEKIEKPVVSGNNQRKGCLWALCPTKMHKMDEEVSKWSKKDPQGIKDAMSHPECLESLERGEMKFESFSGNNCSSEDEEEEFDVDVGNGDPDATPSSTVINCTVLNGDAKSHLTHGADTTVTNKAVQTGLIPQRSLATVKSTDISSLQPIKFINGPINGASKVAVTTHQVLLKTNSQQSRIITQPLTNLTVNGVVNGVNTKITTSSLNGQPLPHVIKKLQGVQHTQQQIQNSQLLRAQIRKSLIQPIETNNVTSSNHNDSDYNALPDSTMSEINLQSNGTLLDDYGNEIKLEGDTGILNTTKNAPLVFRKVVTSTNNSQLNGAQNGFVYSSSHQPKLVLTSAKMS